MVHTRPRMRSCRTLSALVPYVALLAACVTGTGASRFRSTESVVRARAAVELDCPEVYVIELDGGGFRAEGCDRMVSYVCVVDRTNGQVCSRDSAIERVQREEEPPAAYQASEARYVAELAAVSEAVEACTSGRGVGLEITLAADGRVTRLSGEIATATEQECIEAALRPVRVSSVPTPGVVDTSFPPPPRRALGESASATPGASLGAWLDAALARQRDAVLACVGRAVVAVRMSAADGAATWTLQGELAGSPEEECAASVLAAEVPPAAGTLIRVVR